MVTLHELFFLDESFWNFTLTEFAIYDIKNSIQFITDKTQQGKLK